MTWNVRHGLGNDGRVDLTRIAGAIRESGADIVALQELDRGWRRSGGEDQAGVLATALGMHRAFGPNLFRPDEGYGAPATYGTAILSRPTIVACDNTPLPSRPLSERRGVLTATIAIPGSGAIQVACTHLHWGGRGAPEDAVAERRDQVQAILAHSRPSGIPTLLMGDFNAEPESAELAALREPGSGFTDAWAATHGDAPGHTIPTEAPARRIDYIWLAGPVACAAIAVRDTPETRLASDHFPVVADVVLPR